MSEQERSNDLILWAHERIAILFEVEGIEAEVERVDLQGATMRIKRCGEHGKAAGLRMIRGWKFQRDFILKSRMSKPRLLGLYAQLKRG